MDSFINFKYFSNYSDCLPTTYVNDDLSTYSIDILDEITRLRSQVKIIKHVKELTAEFLNKTTVSTNLYPILNDDFQFKGYYYTDITDKVLQIPNGIYYNDSDYLIVYYKYMLITQKLYDDLKLRSMISTYILYHDMPDLKRKYDKRTIPQENLVNKEIFKSKETFKFTNSHIDQIIHYNVKNVNYDTNYSIKAFKQQELQDNVILVQSDSVKNARRVRMLRKVNDIGVYKVDRTIVNHEFKSKFMYDDVLECGSQYGDQLDDDNDDLENSLIDSTHNIDIANIEDYTNYDDNNDDDGYSDNDNDYNNNKRKIEGDDEDIIEIQL